jgi:hypothetical protein
MSSWPYFVFGCGLDPDRHCLPGQTLYIVSSPVPSADLCTDSVPTAPAQEAVEYEIVTFNSDFPEDQ